MTNCFVIFWHLFFFFFFLCYYCSCISTNFYHVSRRRGGIRSPSVIVFNEIFLYFLYIRNFWLDKSFYFLCEFRENEINFFRRIRDVLEIKFRSMIIKIKNFYFIFYISFNECIISMKFLFFFFFFWWSCLLMKTSREAWNINLKIYKCKLIRFDRSIF